jgi:hypothetical protein
VKDETLALLIILNNLRALGPQGGLFTRVFGEVPPDTAAVLYWAAIIKLLRTGYVEVVDEHGSSQPTKTLLKSRNNLAFGFQHTKDADGRDTQWRVRLTAKLGDLQEQLGVSLRQLIESRLPGARITRPLFGKVWGDHKADVFVVMPFKADMSHIYDDHIQNAVVAMGLTVKRGDSVFGSTSIIQEVWELIAQSKALRIARVRVRMSFTNLASLTLWVSR